MANQRSAIHMTDAEVTAMLAAGRKVQLATLGPGGYPHLVAMYYALVHGRIAFWTYRRSQKALNLARDPRITCLVESGQAYFDLRGVQVQGVVETITDPDKVYQLGLRIGTVMAEGLAGDEPVAVDTMNEYVAKAARKRNAYIVEPQRIISWDHAKLLS
ncbi:MAG TPA: pyridoxamine 5'-phosphate oxidase family protein [Streptosporangiaceae bacterium]